MFHFSSQICKQKMKHENDSQIYCYVNVKRNEKENQNFNEMNDDVNRQTQHGERNL